MIPVTKSFLPPIEEYTAYIQQMYDSEWLTNRGKLVLDLEARLKNFLHLEKVNQILLTNNGTTPLQIALKLLGKGGEIITTPFSYVATTSSIVWENCTPVFVDIHLDFLTIDETKIEAAITEKTTCILATHVFGNPCNIEVIDQIAKKYKLKVIYDAAHCFGVQYKGQSIFDFGDVSSCSFHATKLFHTGEGGAIFCHDPELFQKIYYSHNFGHDGPLAFHGLGINGKLSELQAAMGLSVLPYMEEIIESRKNAVSFYFDQLKEKAVSFLRIREDAKWNYSYFPILFESEEQLIAAELRLKDADINARRYFYPSLNQLPYVEATPCPISESVASRIMCLPLYHNLSRKDQELIISLI